MLLIMDDRQEVETRKSIVLLFLDRFTLNDEEVEAITSREVAVGPRFFQSMDKTERIRADCRVLMSGEDGPTKAGYVSPSIVIRALIESTLHFCTHLDWTSWLQPLPISSRVTKRYTAGVQSSSAE